MSQTDSKTDFLEDSLQAASLTNEQGGVFSSSKGFPSMQSYEFMGGWKIHDVSVQQNQQSS